MGHGTSPASAAGFILDHGWFWGIYECRYTPMACIVRCLSASLAASAERCGAVTKGMSHVNTITPSIAPNSPIPARIDPAMPSIQASFTTTLHLWSLRLPRTSSENAPRTTTISATPASTAGHGTVKRRLSGEQDHPFRPSQPCRCTCCQYGCSHLPGCPDFH